MAAIAPVEVSTTATGGEARTYVLRRYDAAISYYWSAAATNKRWYKWTRYLTVVLGACVTLLATVASSTVLAGVWGPVVSVITPLSAALLTITGGLSRRRFNGAPPGRKWC